MKQPRLVSLRWMPFFGSDSDGNWYDKATAVANAPQIKSTTPIYFHGIDGTLQKAVGTVFNAWENDLGKNLDIALDPDSEYFDKMVKALDADCLTCSGGYIRALTKYDKANGYVASVGLGEISFVAPEDGRGKHPGSRVVPFEQRDRLNSFEMDEAGLLKATCGCKDGCTKFISPQREQQILRLWNNTGAPMSGNTLRERAKAALQARHSGNSPEDAAALALIDVATSEPEVTPLEKAKTVAPAEEPPKKDDAFEKALAVEKAAREAAQAEVAKLKSDAAMVEYDRWFSAMTAAGKVTPAERDNTVKVMMSLREADAMQKGANPAYEGDTVRDFKAAIEARPTVKVSASTVLDSDPGENDAARKQREDIDAEVNGMLSGSATGRQYVTTINKGAKK